MDGARPTNGKARKGVRPDEKAVRADGEFKHDVDLLLENVHREIDKINRRLDRIERKLDFRD